LVDRIRNFKSNASWFKESVYEKNVPQARFFMKKFAAGNTYETKCAAGQIF